RPEVVDALAAARRAMHPLVRAQLALDALRLEALEVGPVARGEVVEHAHVVASLDKGVDEVRADEAGAAGDERSHGSHFPRATEELLWAAAVAARPRPSHVRASRGRPATRRGPIQMPRAARMANPATAPGGALAPRASTSPIKNGASQSRAPIAPRSASAWIYAFCTPHSCARVGNASGERFGNRAWAAGSTLS